MPGPWPPDEFAALTGVPTEVLERYRGAGLLDRSGSGVFQPIDVFAVQIVTRYIDEGANVDEVLDAIRASDDLVAKRLYQDDQYTYEEWAERIGRTPDELRTIMTSLGMRSGLFSEQDISAVVVADVLNRAGVPIEGVLEGARVYADNLGRIARAGLQMLHRHVCDRLERDGVEAHEVSRRAGTALHEFAEASVGFVSHLYIDYVVRASIEHAAAHLESRDPSTPEGTRVATIFFADLSLFSALSELEGDEAAVALVDRTDAAIRGLAIRHRGQLVKHIGDEFMLVFERPGDAVLFACDLQRHLAENETEAATRIGMHEGPVLYRMGDYYGRTVNAASRIVSLATANSILVTGSIAEAAANEGVSVQEIGARTLRGTEEPLVLYRLLPPPKA
jgi:class 3 adenylate cyclase